MSKKEFRAAYLATFNKMMSYKLSEAGSNYYTEELCKLADAHPEWADELENND